jgi:glyoxylase-like metal-dependent hydrolase (beta-lactamase superfamily II)
MKIDVVIGTMIETNNYVVGEKEVVLIEASADIKDIKKVVKGRKVKAILLTHGHWDHYISLDKYLAEFDCDVYMTEDALKKIGQGKRSFPADRGVTMTVDSGRVKFIKDGDVLKFNKELTFEVIESKGHTDCSVCYKLKTKDLDILFSGDTLFNNAVGRDDLPTGNGYELIKSLRKLLKFNDDTIILPGHGDATTIGQEKQNLSKMLQTSS